MLYTHLEDYVSDFYNHMGIDKPSQLGVSDISRFLGIEILYSKSISFRWENYVVIKESTRTKEWQQFGHEICHYLIHEGDHRFMNTLFLDFQEYQANHFAYHFCVPTFMLDELSIFSAYDIMNLFNVDNEFALRRLEMYQNKQYIREAYHENYIIGS